MDKHRIRGSVARFGAPPGMIAGDCWRGAFPFRRNVEYFSYIIQTDASIAMISKKLFGLTSDHTSVELFTLRNRKGMEATIMTYGGIVTSLKVPDRRGTMGDVVLGYDHLEGYLKKNPCFGTLVGRYGNRIARGQFVLDGVTYKLAVKMGQTICMADSRASTRCSGRPGP